jgi:hypothetical protein
MAASAWLLALVVVAAPVMARAGSTGAPIQLNQKCLIGDGSSRRRLLAAAVLTADIAALAGCGPNRRWDEARRVCGAPSVLASCRDAGSQRADALPCRLPAATTPAAC